VGCQVINYPQGFPGPKRFYGYDGKKGLTSASGYGILPLDFEKVFDKTARTGGTHAS
jgi:hypothetical protein